MRMLLPRFRAMTPHMSDGNADTTPRGDPLADMILSHIAALPPGKSLAPETVARAIVAAQDREDAPPDAWRRYLRPVKQQALNLARQGKIAILRKGKPVDPHKPVKGVIRLAPVSQEKA